MKMRISVASIFLVTPVLLPLVSSSVTITYLLHTFSNDRGESWGGSDCDPIGRCDTVLRFCFDNPTHPENIDTDTCNYGIFTTGMFENRNSIRFDQHSHTGGVANPLTMHMNSFPLDGFRMKLLVSDVDIRYHDTIDKFFNNYDMKVYGWNEAINENHIRKVYLGRRPSAKTRLEVSTKAQCDAYWYGDICDVYCSEGIPYDDTTNACVVPTSAIMSTTTTTDPNSRSAVNLPRETSHNTSRVINYSNPVGNSASVSTSQHGSSYRRYIHLLGHYLFLYCILPVFMG